MTDPSQPLSGAAQPAPQQPFLPTGDRYGRDKKYWSEISDGVPHSGTILLDWAAAKSAICQQVLGQTFNSYRDAQQLLMLAYKISDDVNKATNPARIAAGLAPFVGNEVAEGFIKEDAETDAKRRGGK